MPYLENIITADAGCSTADKGYAPFGPGVQECYSTLISIPAGKPGTTRIALHPKEYQRLKAKGVFSNGTTDGWFICTNGIKNHLKGLESFDSGFESTKVEGGVVQKGVQVSGVTNAGTIRVSGAYKGNASTAYDIPACFCKCPVTNCCPTEKWPDGGGAQDTNDWMLSCDQNLNSYSPLRAGCF
jgi:hypothetical protein